MTEQEKKALIYNDILIDCNGEGDQNMSWFYYIQDEFEFPFKASIQIKKANGKTITKKIKVIGPSSTDQDFDRNYQLNMEIEFDDYIIDYPLKELKDIKGSEQMQDTIEAYIYWLK